MTNKAVIELHYLPCVAYFAAIAPLNEVKIEANESFQKQSYRNRCYINTAQGKERLTIPLIKANRHHPIQAVEIDYRKPWHVKQWRSIQSAYAKAPFFEFYEEQIWEVLHRQPKYLFELNQNLLTLCLSFLGLTIKVSHTDSYKPTLDHSFTDFRGKINPKNPNGIIHAEKYIQVFGTGFIENLSIIDLLFCEGPNASQIIKETKTKFTP